MADISGNTSTKPEGSVTEVLGVCTRLGLTSFGGPIAHLGYFHEEYVVRRKWIDEQGYADLVALCQFLPGPASSQVGIAMGIERAGLLGGLAAWVGFTLPSAIALMIFAYLMRDVNVATAGWLHGLMIVAVAVVAQAVWSMAQKLAPDKTRGTMAILAAAFTLLWPTALTQVLIIVLAGLVGRMLLRKHATASFEPMRGPIKRSVAVVSLVLFFGLLIFLPLLRMIVHSHAVAVFDNFYRTGSLVFGGGHVVLPLLHNAVVPAGWMTNGEFLAGYGLAQAVPGPLFTFAAYLGAIEHVAPNGWLGAGIALIAIFLPSFLLVVGVLPFWNGIRRHPEFHSVLSGINAAVVGILLAALYNPVWTSAIKSPADFVIAISAFALLVLWKLPPWMVVLFCAIVGMFHV